MKCIKLANRYIYPQEIHNPSSLRISSQGKNEDHALHSPAYHKRGQYTKCDTHNIS